MQFPQKCSQLGCHGLMHVILLERYEIVGSRQFTTDHAVAHKRLPYCFRQTHIYGVGHANSIEIALDSS